MDIQDPRGQILSPFLNVFSNENFLTRVFVCGIQIVSFHSQGHKIFKANTGVLHAPQIHMGHAARGGQRAWWAGTELQMI